VNNNVYNKKYNLSQTQGHTKVLASHPQTVRTHSKNYGNKKDVGVCLSRAYPIAQALALPLLKDKQRQACPRQR